MRSLLIIAGIASLFPVVNRSATAEESTNVAKSDRPNIILFIADDMAWNDCGAYGHPSIQTPALDQLAKDGMRFDQAFLTCSSCSPSRCSIITGRYPHATGAHQLHLPLPAEQVTFVEQMTAAGYYTAAAGKWHLGPGTIPKFSRVVTGMNKWVQTVEERPKDQPFFFWFAFSDPHRGYQKNTIPAPHSADDAVVPPYLPDVPETRGDLAMYYDEITRLDGVVGRVRDELRRQNIAENTLILFISDNGRPFPRCKTTVYDSGIKTPWIVCWPKIVKPGSVCEQLVSSVDIAPTCLELAGLPVGKSFQGVSFRKQLHDPKQSIREFIFGEHNWHDFDDHQRAIRDLRFKYIRTAYTDIPQTPPADAVRSPTYAVMQQMLKSGKLDANQRGCFQVPRPAEELYDLSTDPFELKNLATDPEYGKELVRLRHALTRWESRTGDQIPSTRRPDGFDRETGLRLRPGKKTK